MLPLLLPLLAAAADVDNGALLAGLGGCAACHTADEGPPYAGGHVLETRFGTFYGPNITPDPEHGLGGWTLEDFVDAMRRGRSPEGHPYYPAFPYAAYTGMTDADLADLWAFLQTVEPVATPSLPHALQWPYGGRFLLRLWKALELDVGPHEPDPAQDEAWNRGAYLVRAVGHCGDCHTPRNAIGGLKERRFLGGSDAPPEPSPNITPGAIGDWSASDLATFLEMGMTPEGDFAGAGMTHVIEDGTARLPREDLDAMVAYLRSVRPVREKGEKENEEEDEAPRREAEDW